MTDVTASIGAGASVTASAQGFSPSASTGPTELSWDTLTSLDDLDLTWASGLSSGCTEAQALAALSIDSGGLLVTTADAVTDGADVDFEAFWWLTDPVQGPTEAFHVGEYVSTTSTSGFDVSIGLYAVYLEDGETYGSPPPSGGVTLASGILGGGRGNNFGAHYERMSSSPSLANGSGAHYGFRAAVSR